MITEKNHPSGRTVLNAGAIGLMGWRFLPPLMPIPHRHSDIELNFPINAAKRLWLAEQLLRSVQKIRGVLTECVSEVGAVRVEIGR